MSGATGKSASCEAWILVGPTATGKTAVSCELARRLGAVVLSSDSMLVYKGMDIGTAKPSSSELEDIDVFGIDIVPPSEKFSTGRWLECAKEAFATGRDVIVAGGTGLYINALINGIDAPPSSTATRAVTTEILERGGVEALRMRAEELSPGSVTSLDDPDNPRRLMRLVEKLLAGATASDSDKRLTSNGGIVAGLEISPTALAVRIEARVIKMFEDGLLDEVAELRRNYPGFSETAGKGIGYAEAAAVLDGVIDRKEAIQKIALRTRQLAKRQRTWFRHQLDVDWIRGPENKHDVARAADDVMEAWKRHGKTRISIRRECS